MNRPMTDREMLLFAYGALKAEDHPSDGKKQVFKIIEDHLWQTNVELVFGLDAKPLPTGQAPIVP